MNEYKLYHVKSEYIRDWGFVSLDYAKSRNGVEKLPRNVWKEVYTFQKETPFIDAIDDLEDVYRMFNEERPADYKLHSMSVSDIVETAYGLWYCDTYGFKRVEWQDSDE